MCVLFLDESFNFPLLSCVLRVKNSMTIPFPGRFWLVDMWKYATKQKLLHIKKGNASGNEITQHSCIKSKTRGKLASLQETCKRKVSEFRISKLVTSFSISSPKSLVFTTALMTMRIFFVITNIGKARDPATLCYQLTDNF